MPQFNIDSVRSFIARGKLHAFFNDLSLSAAYECISSVILLLIAFKSVDYVYIF